MVNYSVGDFLVRIKNAVMAGRREIVVSETKLIKAVGQVLKKEGYLDSATSKDGKLTVSLAYHKKESVLINLKLVSKPGLRVYMTVDELSKMRGISRLVLSTPKGVMSAKEALKNGVGGEVLVEVW